MGTRLELHNKLVDLLGSSEVYFQPPESVKMKYPAIVYSLDEISTHYADNRSYASIHRYKITLIERNPDSKFIDAIQDNLQSIQFDRAYTSDNLNHYVYIIYY